MIVRELVKIAILCYLVVGASGLRPVWPFFWPEIIKYLHVLSFDSLIYYSACDVSSQTFDAICRNIYLRRSKE